jgi:hypothetical protein
MGSILGSGDLHPGRRPDLRTRIPGSVYLLRNDRHRRDAGAPVGRAGGDTAEPGVQRLVVAITFIGIAALGALAAGGLVLATGIVPTEQSWYVMTSGLGIALLVATLLFTHEMARERRARAERALEEEAARRGRSLTFKPRSGWGRTRPPITPAKMRSSGRSAPR